MKYIRIKRFSQNALQLGNMIVELSSSVWICLSNFKTAEARVISIFFAIYLFINTIKTMSV